MSRLVFGVDEPPKETGERMAYIGRAACGHIVVARVDNGPKALHEFLGMGIGGLMVERVPSRTVREEASAGCHVCAPPEHLEMGL